MNALLPAFDWHRVMVTPWAENASVYGWVVLMGIFVSMACGWVGVYLILRRMALMGDAISHSVLPGLAIAFLFSGQRSTWVMFAGALSAGVLTTVIIETIHKRSRVKQDSAIGIAFSSLFALGVILISVFAAQVDLDQECVLYGEIAFVPLAPMARVGEWALGPVPVVRMGAVALLTGLGMVLFYKELLVSSFDPGLARSLGMSATLIHYVLMSWLSVTVVSAFESVGAILVIAMLILPGATASLISNRLPVILLLTVVHGVLSAVAGLHLAVWLDCSTAGAMVVMGTVWFHLAWLFGPAQGVVVRWWRTQADAAPTSVDGIAAEGNTVRGG